MSDSEHILTRPPPPANHRFSYGSNPYQFGDLRIPEGDGPHPVLAFIHGGFWRASYDLEHSGHLCAALAATGIATWNIEYRRLGNLGGGWPGTFRDVARGIKFLRVLAPKFSLDLGQVSVMGHSAGGHLALWVAAARKIPESSPIAIDEPLPLCGVVSLAGVCDLILAWKLGLSDWVVEELLEGGPQEYPARYAHTSPKELLPLGVTQVLIHGRRDQDVPYELSERYITAALANKDEVTFISLPDIGHFELIDPNSSVWQHVYAAAKQTFTSFSTSL